ncbi:hypothetical protein KSP39_PZI024368 [Platanthera zijinensis]|uniref:Zinc-ribbon domain-containing protein n=1 Tax=Platanthera zijinensis TaxID=2320716 RepID=A0AAP0FU32_9ASPA
MRPSSFNPPVTSKSCFHFLKNGGLVSKNAQAEESFIGNDSGIRYPLVARYFPEVGESGGGGAKVRVVRCPKCDKLLPELANFTVYRCGGCDATLQAKKQPSVLEASPEKDGGELSKHSAKNSDVNAKEELVFNKSRDDALNEGESPRTDCFPTGKSEASDAKFQHRSMDSLNSPVRIVNGPGKRKVEDDLETNSRALFSNDHSKFRETKAWEVEDMNKFSVFHGAPWIPMGDIHASPYLDTAPLHTNPYPNHVNCDGAAKRNNLDGADRVELLEQDRAELLRKLDELRDQLKRSCDIFEAPKERLPAHNMSSSSSSYAHNGRSNWCPDFSSTSNRNPSEHSPFSNGHNADMPRSYRAAHTQNGVHGYKEASRYAPFNSHGQYAAEGASNNYMYKQFDSDPVISYHNDGFYHQPACACMHCYNGHWLAPSQIPPTVPSNLRAPPCPLGNHGFYAVDGPSVFGSQGYNHRISRAPLHPYEPCNQNKVSLTRKESRPCRPVAGAAPFIVCYNCSELLQIPEQIMQIGKHQHKLRCGSCSLLISFELDGTRLLSSKNISVLPVASENHVDLTDGSKEVLPCHGNINRRQVISYSIDYDSPVYSDEKIVMPTFPISSNVAAEKVCGLNLSDPEKLRGISSSSNTSDGVESPDSVICQRDVPSSAELPAEGDAVTRVPSLPLREHFGYSSGNQAGDDPGSVSMSKRSDQEKVASFKGNFKQNSVKDVPVATELDFSAEDYPSAGFSQESWDVSKDEEETRVSKGGDSFLGGLIKKSFKDFPRFNQSTENGRSKVSVNGHYVSDRLVKRAEKLAGPIHPGDYW